MNRTTLTAIIVSLVVAMAIITVDFSRVSETMNDSFVPLLFDQHRYLVLDGGTNSGKSKFSAQKCVYRTVAEPRHRILIVRKVARTLRESCWEEIKVVISNWQFNSLFSINKSDYVISCPGSSGKMIFVGLDDPDKLKSIKDITSVWIEEATELMPSDLAEIGRRLRGVNGTYQQAILSFNPILVTHWLKPRFFDTDQRGLTRTHISTFRDNRFLTAETLLELEDLKARDPEAYEVYGEARWGRKLSGLVYGSDIIVQRGEYPDPHLVERTIHGLDFGYNDPACLLKIDIVDNVHFIHEMIYETGLTNDDLIAKMDMLKISKTYPIYADSARPDNIEDIYRAGYNILPAEKPRGSVNAGISFVKSTIIKSMPSNVNFNAEWNSYAWLRDKYGVILDDSEDKNNHAMDALRYPIYMDKINALPPLELSIF